MNNDEKNVLYKGANELLYLLANAADLQDMAEKSFELFGNPLVISDRSWTALAITGDESVFGDIGWTEFATKGTLSLNTIKQSVGMYLAKKIETSTEPFIWTEPTMKYRRLIGKVTTGRTIMATVSIIESHRDFTDLDIKLMYDFCSAVSAILQRDRYKYYTESPIYEDFIINILNGKLADNKGIEEKLRIFNLDLRENITAIVVNVSGFDKEGQAIIAIKDRLERKISMSKAAIYEGHIVLLKAYGEKTVASYESREADLKSITDYLQANGLRCGVSRGFSDLINLPENFNMAMSALRVGSRIDEEKLIYHFDDMVTYVMADLLTKKGLDSSLLHPGINLLLDYDKEHNTTFSESLRVWLDASRNAKTAADALHLHRNTLIYHLKRASQIADIDLEDAPTLLYVEMTYRMIDVIGIPIQE
jgi:hypothetical protein